ncbi:MAG: SIMPL domain-containing protein [Flavobacteriales bacterium]|nr:SIMPL domain-containing protein [Flavobacteriales bacterium]
MKRTQYVLIIILLFAAQEAFSQVAGNIIYNESARWQFQNQVEQLRATPPASNMVNFEINAICNIQADSYLAIFHVTQAGASAREADSLINQRINSFKASLEQKRLKDTEVVIDMLSMVPVYHVEVTKQLFSKTYTEIPAGFEIQKNIHVHFKDVQVLDQIITSAAMEEIYDLIKVDYYVKNVEAIYDSLRHLATELLADRVAQFEEIGVPLKDQWRYVTDRQGVYFPLDRYTTYESVSSTSIEAAQKKRRGGETYVPRRKKNKTLFYNKVPYTSYDIVVNPEIIEPAVQYVYNLQVRFEVERPKEEEKPAPAPKPETKIKTEYILVSPDGKTTRLPNND